MDRRPKHKMPKMQKRTKHKNSTRRMKKTIVTTRVYTRNFIDDFISKIRNLVGARLIAYEQMIQKAAEEAIKEAKEKGAKEVKVQITEFSNEAICILIYGEAE